MTTRRIPRNMTAMFYQFAIIQCLYEMGLEQYFNHVQASEGNGERINRNSLKEKYQVFSLLVHGIYPTWQREVSISLLFPGPKCRGCK